MADVVADRPQDQVSVLLRGGQETSAASADLVRQSTVDTTNRWYDVQPFALAMQVLAERLIDPHVRPPLRR